MVLELASESTTAASAGAAVVVPTGDSEARLQGKSGSLATNRLRPAAGRSRQPVQRWESDSIA